MNDAQLLREYWEQGLQAAFGRIMEQHYGLVLATCRRELADRQDAEDAAQVVFLILSKKARSIRAQDSVAGWLFQTARFVCKDMRRQAQRRQVREQKAEEVRRSEQVDRGWSEIEPLINDGLASLSSTDCNAVLLRFFEGMSFAETASALGVSEDAAKKRVSRAIGKLRTYFTRHNIPLESEGIAVLLSTHETIDLGRPRPARFAPGPHLVQLSQRMTRTMIMTKLKIAAAVVLLGATLAMTVYRSSVAGSTGATGSSAQMTAHSLAPVQTVKPTGAYPMVRKIVLKGNKLESDAKLLNGFEQKIGQPLNPDAVNRSIANIMKLYDIDGYRADVSATAHGSVNLNPSTGTLTIPILESHVSSIVVSGNHKVNSALVVSAMKLRAGMLYDRFQLSQDGTAVYNLGLFQNVSTSTATPEPGKVAITVTVKEK